MSNASEVLSHLTKAVDNIHAVNAAARAAGEAAKSAGTPPAPAQGSAETTGGNSGTAVNP